MFPFELHIWPGDPINDKYCWVLWHNERSEWNIHNPGTEIKIRKSSLKSIERIKFWLTNLLNSQVNESVSWWISIWKKAGNKNTLSSFMPTIGLTKYSLNTLYWECFSGQLKRLLQAYSTYCCQGLNFGCPLEIRKNLKTHPTAG